MKIHGLGSGAALLLCLGVPAATAAAQPADGANGSPGRYTIGGDRAMAAGDAYRWSSNEYNRTTITRGAGDDAEVESDTYLKYGILANSQVNEVDENDQPIRVTHIIENLYLWEDALLPEGTVLVATRGEEGTRYTIGDDLIENETILYVLDKLADLDEEAQDAYEASLRLPDEPQPVGARWEIDGPGFFSAVLDIDEPLDENQASGEIHLAAAEEVFGSPGVRLDIQFMLNGVVEAFAEARPDWELQSSTYLIEGELKVPQSDEHLEMGAEMQFRLTQSWHDPDGDEQVEIETYTEISSGQRELSADERELLGFEAVPATPR